MLKGSVPPKEEKGRLDKPQQWAKKQAPTTWRRGPNKNLAEENHGLHYEPKILSVKFLCLSVNDGCWGWIFVGNKIFGKSRHWA